MAEEVDVGDCRWQGSEAFEGGIRSRCSCGWRSSAAGSADEAGRASDLHRAANAAR